MKKFGVIVFGMGLLLGQPVAAQEYVPNIAPALPFPGTVQYAYNNPGAYVIASWNSVYVGPYEGTLHMVGADPTNAPISLYCVDFSHYVLKDKLVNATVSNLGGGDVSATRLGAGGLDAYKKAAYLSSLFSSYTSTADPVLSALGQQAAFSGIHAAIWYFISGAGPYTGDPYWEDFRDYANGNWTSYAGYGAWSVLTTTSVENFRIQDSQEVLVQSAFSSVQTSISSPEPQTYALLGIGLIFLVFVGRRRLKEQGYA
jgi:hypothetical protein